MPSWEKYEVWNDAILDVVFPELEVPQPVYLDFEDEILEGLSARIGVAAGDVEDALCKAVAATLRKGGPAAIFSPHMSRVRSWSRGGRAETPPFLALLGAFCVAAERMAAGDGMSSANYFGRLRAVLGWDPTDHRLDQAYRGVAEKLWGELNRWLVEMDGQRGLPTAYALNHRFVGLTMSQALVRSADREKLREFFRQYGFAPGADVAPAELAPLLTSWISQRPCPVSTSLERLWHKGQARERIAQAAAVALAGWDGSVRDRGAGGEGRAAQGHLALSLELGGFPRKRFAFQAILYLPEPHRPRHAEVVTATPSAQVELVPDLPGALGLGRGSSLHAGDVLEGILRIEDSLTGQTLERRPRRLVVFREDELSRRWIESPHVMLGESLRLLVHESLAPRLTDVLEEVARPGWEQLEPYPGQPDGWLVFAGVEVFNHPGALVKTQGMDDLSALIPLTSSQLKIAGGFALPGQMRGKWHTWAPPEIRAVSDAADGFAVRLVDVNGAVDDEGLAEDVLVAEWQDDDTGVIVQSLADLGLADGDYRVELVPHGSKTALTSASLHMRSADTPDRRQWSLLEPVSYGPGLGALGVAVADAVTTVKGHVVESRPVLSQVEAAVPSAPRWQLGSSNVSAGTSVVRLTMPDTDSCLHTGRHREQIETVPTDDRGKPLQAWSYGRCSGCGLVRRYPTRLRSFGGRKAREEPAEAPRPHDLSALAPRSETERDWTTAFDAILHTGGGSWSQLERIAFQIEASALFLDQLARTLEVLGHIDIRRDPSTLDPVAWEVAPTALAGTAEGLLFSGFWPSALYADVGSILEDGGVSLSLAEHDDGPASYFADCSAEIAKKLLSPDSSDVPVIDLAWQDLVSVLPPLSEVLAALPRQADALVGDVSWFRPADNSWLKVASLDAPGAYRVRRFSTIDVVRDADDVGRGSVARSTVQLGKHLAALMAGSPLMAYDREMQTLFVPLGADLPGLYGRAATAASGEPPTPLLSQRLLRYGNVPPDLAAHLYDLMSR